MENFQNKLKEIREEKDLTKAEISEILQIHPQTWHKYESGMQRMSLETLRNFCQMLDVSADWMLDLTEERSRSLLTQFYCKVIDTVCEYEENNLIESNYTDLLINEINDIYKYLLKYTVPSQSEVTSGPKK